MVPGSTALSARIVSRTPMRYRHGADPGEDRPAHVRAASGLVRFDGALVVVQDDAHFLGVVDAATGLTDPIALPPGPGGRRTFDRARGNKADKLDLEAAFALAGDDDDGGLLVAIGSGAPLGPRRSVVTVRRADSGWAAAVHALPRWFDAIAAALLPAGTSLNLEGAAVIGDQLIVANRGGDAGHGGIASPDALVATPLAAWRRLLDDPAAPLPPLAIRRLDAGALDGGALHVTDLASAHGRLWFLATAEATTSFFDDGPVAGSAIGVLAPAGERARWAPVTGADGAVAHDKLEGLAATDDARRWLAVIDPDDPDRPSELVELALDGDWLDDRP